MVEKGAGSGLQILPLMAGLVFAQFGYWVGLIGMKRG